MYYSNDYCASKPVENESIAIHEIYHVTTDGTYQVKHVPYPQGMKVLVFTEQGQGYLQCTDGEFILGEKSALLFPADTYFSYHTVGEMWKFWWFAYSGNAADVTGILYTVKGKEWLNELCERSLDALRDEKPSAASYLSGIIAVITESAPGKNDPGREIFSKAQMLIKENYYHNTVASIASEVGVESRTLYNLFLHYGGCSPKVYMRTYVMDMAKLLLCNTTKSIAEIAEELGFANQFHFSRVFKESFGMAPTTYRLGMRS